MEASHVQEEEHDILVEPGLDKQHDELESENAALPPTQGIFAHSTSLEDFITDEVGNLDLQNSANEERDYDEGMGAGSVMKSSIHELQGEDTNLLANESNADLTQISKNNDTKSGER